MLCNATIIPFQHLPLLHSYVYGTIPKRHLVNLGLNSNAVTLHGGMYVNV